MPEPGSDTRIVNNTDETMPSQKHGIGRRSLEIHRGFEIISSLFKDRLEPGQVVAFGPQWGEKKEWSERITGVRVWSFRSLILSSDGVAVGKLVISPGPAQYDPEYLERGGIRQVVRTWGIVGAPSIITAIRLAKYSRLSQLIENLERKLEQKMIEVLPDA